MSENSTYVPTPQDLQAGGVDQWIRTRMCFCDADAPTDCRFHNPKEKGWEQCPNLELGKTGKKLGRWLWARNPNFGKITEAAEESLLTEPD